jgi:outer membrane lipoprotein-sorting protein
MKYPLPNNRPGWFSSIGRAMCAVALLLLTSSQLPAQDDLVSTIAGMDAAAAKFSSVTGEIEYTKVTVLVNDFSTEKGKIYFEKSKGKLRVMLAFTQPAEKYVLFSDGKVQLYQPRIAEVQEFTLGKNQDMLEQFLLLGFGTSGTEMLKSYTAVYKGREKVDGEDAVRLDLTPKSPSVANKLTHIELWLSPQTWQPIQQKFYEPSKDYLIARYRGLQLNTRITPRNLQLQLHGNVKVTKH